MSDIPAENTPSKGVRGLGSGARDVTKEFYAQASEAVFERICDNVGEEVSALLSHSSQAPKVRRNGFEFVDVKGRVWRCEIDRYFIGIPAAPGQEDRIDGAIAAARAVIANRGPGELALDKVQSAEAFHTTLMYQGKGDIVFTAKGMLEGRPKTTVYDDEASNHGLLSADGDGMARENNIRDLYAAAAEAFEYFRNGEAPDAPGFSFDRCAYFRHPGYDREVYSTAILPAAGDDQRIRRLHRIVWDVDAVRRGSAEKAFLAKSKFLPHNTLIQTKAPLSDEVQFQVLKLVDEILVGRGPVLSENKLRGWARLQLWDPEANVRREDCDSRIAWMVSEAVKAQDSLSLGELGPDARQRTLAKLARIKAEIIRLRDLKKPTHLLKHARLFDID